VTAQVRPAAGATGRKFYHARRHRLDEHADEIKADWTTRCRPTSSLACPAERQAGRRHQGFGFNINHIWDAATCLASSNWFRGQNAA
jgi:hypothetical protein